MASCSSTIASTDQLPTAAPLQLIGRAFLPLLQYIHVDNKFGPTAVPKALLSVKQLNILVSCRRQSVCLSLVPLCLHHEVDVAIFVLLYCLGVK